MKVECDARDVLHFKKHSSQMIIYGHSRPSTMLSRLSFAATGDEQALQDMAKGGKMKYYRRGRVGGTWGTLAGSKFNKQQGEQVRR